MNDRIALNVEPLERSGGPAAGSYLSKVREEHCDPTRVLLIDDDPAIQRMVTTYLAEQNMGVVAACSRKEIARQLSSGAPGLVILELSLGQDNGLDVLREIRSRSDVPVIIVTSRRGDEIDRVIGLELGADDYVTKPFVPRELLARIHAVLRRFEIGRTAPPRPSKPSCCRFGGFELDRRMRRLTNAEAVPITLTRKEYALLTAFLDAPQRPLSREQLVCATRVHDDVFDRSIDVLVMRLRRKLEPNPETPCIIRTERGVGYVFCLPVELVRRNMNFSGGY